MVALDPRPAWKDASIPEQQGLHLTGIAKLLYGSGLWISVGAQGRGALMSSESAGAARVLGDGGRVDPPVAEHAVIQRELGEQFAPLERWSSRLADVLADPKTARRLAARLREGLMRALATLQSAGGSAADLVKAIIAAREEGDGDA